MKLKNTFLLVTWLIIIFNPIVFIAQEAINNFQTLKTEFLNPSKEFGSVPFFVLNNDVSKEEVEANMIELKNSGCGGIIFHPRPGLITEYLSENWFELFRHAVEVGNKIGMNVWIYDENSYPSGFAGGHVPAEMPESYNHGQGLQPKDTTTIPHNYLDYFIILKKDGDKYIDVTYSAGKEIGKHGEYIMFKKTYYQKKDWHGGFPYVDILHEGVTQKFLDVTLTGYVKTASDQFGKIVQGVFTDEPEINTPGGIRWTPDLFKIFTKHWGYDLQPNLPSLYKEVGDWKKIRHNYTRTLLSLFIERWSVPTSEYYKKLGLKYTGHYWEHGWPAIRMGPDNMAMYAYHDVPGIDMLFNQFNEESPNAQFGNVRAVKELSSVANQFGRMRTLSETYGGAGWEITFKDLKRLGDWQYALGVNLMNQHLHFFSIAGSRKYDYPPSFSYHNPWFKNYKFLNEYFNRLSVALSSGKQINKILVIEPTTTGWMYDSFIRNLRHSQIFKIGESFQEFVTILEKNQVEYDLGSEDIISNHGVVSGKGFKVGERTYSLVVIPPLTETLDNKVYELLKKYVDSGGSLISFSNPNRVNGEIHDETAKFFKNKTVVKVDSLDQKIISSYFLNEEIKFENIKGGNLFHHRRILDDGQIIFLVNSSLDEAVSGSLLLQGKDAVLLDAFKGEVIDYDENADGKNIKINFEMNPAESMLFYVSNKKQNGLQKKFAKQVLPVNTGSSLKVLPSQQNVLPIDFCDLEVNGRKIQSMHVYDASQKAFIENGFNNGNPWDQKVQYKTNILDRNNFSASSGFKASYNFKVVEDFDFSGLTAVVERPELWTVQINNKTIAPIKGEWWLDRSFGVFKIGDFVKMGENNITINCSPMSVHAEIEPVYILGNFSVQPEEKGWSIYAPKNNFTTGSWKAQGFPFYSWDVSYKKEFDVQQKSSYYEIGLGNWKGTVAEVFVNDNSAGLIALAKDRLDVSKYIKKGKNLIEVKIVGSLKNLLGPHHNNPAPGFVGFVSWRKVNGMTAGKDYQLLDYGLMDDFYLYQNQ